MKTISNLTRGNEKLVKYAVLQISVSENIDNEILNIKKIYCDKTHIFDDETLADQFCDHANKSEQLSYKWLVTEIIIDR